MKRIYHSLKQRSANDVARGSRKASSADKTPKAFCMRPRVDSIQQKKVDDEIKCVSDVYVITHMNIPIHVYASETPTRNQGFQYEWRIFH